jgi:hypothetical protein
MPTTSKNPLDDLSPAAQQRRQKTRARMEKAGAFLLAPGLVRAPKKKRRRRRKKPTNESNSAKPPRKASSSPRGARKSKPEKKPAGDDKKKKDTSIPLAFEVEADGGADEMVATAELEPWARIGTLRIACQVLEKDGDDLSWQFELADLWFQ